MGRDEHNKSHGKNFLAQTPKNEKTDGIDVEFSEEFADQDDKDAQRRGLAADRRARKKG